MVGMTKKITRRGEEKEDIHVCLLLVKLPHSCMLWRKSSCFEEDGSINFDIVRRSSKN